MRSKIVETTFGVIWYACCIENPFMSNMTTPPSIWALGSKMPSSNVASDALSMSFMSNSLVFQLPVNTLPFQSTRPIAADSTRLYQHAETPPRVVNETSERLIEIGSNALRRVRSATSKRTGDVKSFFVKYCRRDEGSKSLFYSSRRCAGRVG